MRIAIGAFGLESSTFTPIQPSRADLHIKHEDFVHPEVARYYKDAGAELVPTMLIAGTPTGVLDQSTYCSLKEEFLASFQAALPCDGLSLSMHGSMLVHGIGHGEFELLKSIRAIVGPAFPISVRLDLHGNIPDGFVEQASVVTALRTAPHRDGLETALRASRLLVRLIQENLRPVTRLIRLPLLFSGEQVVTENEPARSLYAMIEDVEQEQGILAASVMVGFAWGDLPYSGASVIVTAHDAEQAEAAARKLACAFWERRAEFQIDGEHASPGEALAAIRCSGCYPVFLSDSGDNVTAGAPGDSTFLLEKLLAAGVREMIFAQIADPAVFSQCVQAGEGAALEIVLGGKMEKEHGRPLPLKVVVQKLHEQRIVLLRCEENHILVTSQRFPVYEPPVFEALGVPLSSCKVAVFKLGYLMPELRDIAPRSIIVLTPGPTTLDLKTLPYRNLRRPIYPLDPAVELNCPLSSGLP